MSREPETTIRANQYTPSDFIAVLLNEADIREMNTTDLRDKFLWWLGRNITQPLDYTNQQLIDIRHDIEWYLSDAGYANTTRNDKFIIMPKGVGLPIQH